MDAVVEGGKTLNYVVDSSCTKYKDEPAIGMAMETPLTYGEFQERILALAARLMKEGIAKGDHVAILGENSHCWGIAYLAIVRIGAVGVPILPDLPESDVQHIFREMQVNGLFITHKQLEKIYEIRKEISGPVITLDDHADQMSMIQSTTFSSYLDEALTTYREAGEKPVFPEVGEEDLASILYTSGTSGYSRAVMLSHKNFAANAYAASILADVPRNATWLSILPMSHTYEFTCGFILPLVCGARIAYAGKTPTPAILQKLCEYEKPYAIFAVPLVLEKIYKKRVIPQIEQSIILKLLCKVGVTRRLIYRKIGLKLRGFFGGQLGFMGVGGAALNPDVEKFLVEADFPYLIGYGMTESAPLIAGGPLADPTIAIGSTGKPIDGVELRIEDPDPASKIGEITIKSPCVMQGYYKDKEATDEVLTEDGWLSTGDLGFMDDLGNLHVCGRSKNVIVMANGKNVYPEAIEHKINAYPYVTESLVVESNDQLQAWIYPDYELIDEEMAGKSKAMRREFIEKLLTTMRDELNKELPRTTRLARVFERREPFIKTATHKIKRYLYSGHTVLG